MDSSASFSAVDVVPRWAASIGVISVIGTLVLALLGESTGGEGLILMTVLLLASLGVTLGTCGVILAVRDRRHLGLALVGTLGSLALPLYLLTGMPLN